MCEMCNEGTSSKKLVLHKLKTSLHSETMNESEMYNDCELFQKDSLWKQSFIESVHGACVQHLQIQSFFNELKGEKVDATSQQFEKASFMNNVFNNSHKESHVKKMSQRGLH